MSRATVWLIAIAVMLVAAAAQANAQEAGTSVNAKYTALLALDGNASAEPDALQAVNVKSYKGEGGEGVLEFLHSDTLDGIGHMQIEDASKYDFGRRDFAISAWIKTDAQNEGAIVSKASYVEGRGYKLKINSGGTLAFSLWNEDESIELETAQAINDGKWHHVAASRSSLWVKIFVDGEEKAFYLGGPVDASNAGKLSIGAGMADYEWSGTPRAPFAGQVASPKIYGNAIAEDGALELFAKGLA